MDTAMVLETAAIATKAIPIAGTYLESVLGTAAQIAKIAERAKSNREDCQLLARRAATVAGAIAHKVMRMDVQVPAILSPDLADLLRTFDRTQNLAEKLSELSMLKRLANYSKINMELRRISLEFQDALDIFGINARIDSGLEMANLRIILEGIQRTVDNIAITPKSESAYDGDFMLFRLSDLIIQRKLRQLHGEDAAAYLVSLRSTQETLVMKRYSRRDAAYNIKLALLQYLRSRFANVEQLLGYSRDGSAPFYVTYAGRTDAKACMTGINSIEKLRHVVISTHEIRDTLQSLRDYVSQLYELYWYGTPCLGGNGYITVRSQKTLVYIEYSPYVDQSGRIVFDIELSEVELRRRRLYWDRSYRRPPRVQAHPVWLHHISGATSHRTLESSKSALLEELLASRDDGHIDDYLFTSHILNAEFASVGPVLNIGRDDHPCIHWRGRAVTGVTNSCHSRSLVQIDGLAAESNVNSYDVLADGTIRHTVDVLSGISGVSFHTHACPNSGIMSAWSWLLVHGIRLADCLQVSATDLGAVSELATKGTTNIATLPAGGMIPPILYFFEYPHVEVGPPTVAWGYWAWDEDGGNASTVVSCYYDGYEWNLELQLDSLMFTMTRQTDVYYAALSDDLVRLIRDCHAEDCTCDDNTDSEESGTDDQGFDDNDSEEYLDAQDLYSKGGSDELPGTKEARD